MVTLIASQCSWSVFATCESPLCVCVCVRACVRACMRVRVRACVCACVTRGGTSPGSHGERQRTS